MYCAEMYGDLANIDSEGGPGQSLTLRLKSLESKQN